MTDVLKIKGGKRLKGTVTIGGAKNSALKLMAAAILTDGVVELSNIPHLVDISTMMGLISDMGGMVTLLDHNKISINSAKIKPVEISYDLVKAMRASIVVLGPLLGRFKKAKVALPGGCAIGSRPVDMHIQALEKMGAVFEIEEGYIIGKAPRGGLKGAEIEFRDVTVTGTENVMMAATLAKGTTVLNNAACEPEVKDLADLLNAMGAKVKGAGTPTIEIEGVEALHSAKHPVCPDRVEAGTYLIATAAAGGEVLVKHANPEDLGALCEKLTEAGAKLTFQDSGIHLSMRGRPKAVSIKTAPHPGFPTDLQAQFMALNCVAEGVSTVEETIFENRMMHVGELRRFGAEVSIKNHIATVTGKEKLSGAPVEASDLRASAALVIGALVAKGTTTIAGVSHMDRGYEYIEEKLRGLGAKVSRVTTS